MNYQVPSNEELLGNINATIAKMCDQIRATVSQPGHCQSLGQTALNLAQAKSLVLANMEPATPATSRKAS
jgi:hypothetical protein